HTTKLDAVYEGINRHPGRPTVGHSGPHDTITHGKRFCEAQIVRTSGVDNEPVGGTLPNQARHDRMPLGRCHQATCSCPLRQLEAALVPESECATSLRELHDECVQ